MSSHYEVNVFKTDLSSKSPKNAYDFFPFPRISNPLVLVVCIHLENSYNIILNLLKLVLV